MTLAPQAVGNSPSRPPSQGRAGPARRFSGGEGHPGGPTLPRPCIASSRTPPATSRLSSTPEVAKRLLWRCRWTSRVLPAAFAGRRASRRTPRGCSCRETLCEHSTGRSARHGDGRCTDRVQRLRRTDRHKRAASDDLSGRLDQLRVRPECPNARFILAETFTNSGRAPVKIMSGRLEDPKNASHLDSPVALGQAETVNSWRLPFGSDQPALAKLWGERTPIVGTSIAAGDSLQIAFPIALKPGRRTGSAGPIEITYDYSGKPFRAVGVADLKLNSNKC